MAEKKYSAQTKRVLKHTGEQTANARELASLRDYFAKQAGVLKKEMEGMESPDPFNPYSGKIMLKPGYWDKQTEWGEVFDRELEFERAAEEAPFNMTALLQAAVREHGMPKKRTENRGALLTQEAAQRLLQATSRR